LKQTLIMASDGPASTERGADVVYGRTDDCDLVGTLYQPEQVSGVPVPAVVYIHGGGWQLGTREQFLRHAAAMAAKDSPDYALSTG
jgi:acetyl esterase/lipase